MELLRAPTVHDAIVAVERGGADRAFVPFENSIEGSVRSTLDTLAFDTERVTIVGEHDFRVHAHLIAREGIGLEQIAAILSIRSPSPSAPAFCASTCRGSNGAASAAPPRRCGWSASRCGPGRRSAPAPPPTSTAAPCCAEGSRTRPTTSPASSGSPPRTPSRPARAAGGRRWSSPSWAPTTRGRSSNALQEFSSRGVNLSRIESRPLRQGLGRYMFFCDLEGGLDDPPVAEALEALRAKAENVRILGSYPIG